MNKSIGRKHNETIGLLYGFLGVLAFSGTLPATRIAVTNLDPTFVGLGRALVAAVLAFVLLGITKQPIPPRKYWRSFVIVAAGVVFGFPLLSAWAMHQLPASHGAIITGLVPLATAIAGTLRAGEQPSSGFWLTSIVGSTTVIVFAVIESHGTLEVADTALIGAVIAAGLGYAEGGKLARKLGGWQVICWALVLAAPILTIPIMFAVLQHGISASPHAWLAFAYLSVVSMFLGFFAWYRGLAIGGIARVGQVQLLQPFLTILFSALLLGEKITLVTMTAAAIVILSVAVSRKQQIKKLET